MRGTPMAELVLSGDERDTLGRWARRHTSSQALALRCRIVLAYAEGPSNSEVGVDLGVDRKTVASQPDSSRVVSTGCMTNPARVVPARSAMRMSSG